MLLICSNLLVLNHCRTCLIAQVDFDWRYRISVLKLERRKASMWRNLVKFLRRWPDKTDLVTGRPCTPTRQAFQRIVLLHDETFMQESWKLRFLAVQQLFESLLLIKWLLLDLLQSFVPTIFIFLEHLFKVLFLHLEASHVFGKLMPQNPAKVLSGINALFYSLDNDEQCSCNSIEISIGFLFEGFEALYLVFNLLNLLIRHLLT